MQTRVGLSIAALLVIAPLLATGQEPAARPPMPVDPIAAIIDAFHKYDVVAISDPHGNVQIQAFLLSVVRDSRFAAVVNDIVIESASARYQDAIDRFVRGDDVPRNVLRQAWEDHTVVNSLGVQAEELINAVRDLNRAFTDPKKLRVIAGDPPIDWSNVLSGQDHRRWTELRDSYPADLIRRQVLDRRRRALVLYGQGHLQRRQIVSNYDMSTWQSQTVVSLLERDHGASVFNVWTLLDRKVEVPAEITGWHVPSLAMLRGTTLGARDFETYSRGFGFPNRFGVKGDQLAPLPKSEWKMMRMEEQFDALLYLGPPASMNEVTVPRALCHDSQFIRTRLDRLTRFGPPVEVEQFKKACALP